MAAVTRLGDLCTGHGCWPPRASSGGDPFFRLGGIPVHRAGDAWASHTCPAIPETHGGVLAAGASWFRVNGQALGRVGDPVSCGAHVATGADWFQLRESGPAH